MNKPIPFGKYYLLERINVGGMAEVFRAKQFGVEGFERLVAVKRILPNIAEDKEFIEMFVDEAKISVQLTHANIAQVFDLGHAEGSYYIALEHIHGRDLRAVFDRNRDKGEPMPVPQACFVTMKVCEGLDYAHNKRDESGRELHLVHRDVSPQNIIVSHEGEVKLIDFGIAKAAGRGSQTQAGVLKGKFGYMSPEQVRGLPVDRRSDVFACGIVLYELLTGERLFVGESDFSTLEKVRNVEILPPSTYNRKIQPELERIVLKALAKDVEDRYQNAIDLHDELQAFVYTSGEFYSRKDLATWMKHQWSKEIKEESAKLASFRDMAPPVPKSETPADDGRAQTVGNGARKTNPPPIPGARKNGPARKIKKTASLHAVAPSRQAATDRELDWDEDELETSIYDDDGVLEEASDPAMEAPRSPASRPEVPLAAASPDSTNAPMAPALTGSALTGSSADTLVTPMNEEPDLSSLVATTQGWDAPDSSSATVEDGEGPGRVADGSNRTKAPAGLAAALPANSTSAVETASLPAIAASTAEVSPAFGGVLNQQPRSTSLFYWLVAGSILIAGGIVAIVLMSTRGSDSSIAESSTENSTETIAAAGTAGNSAPSATEPEPTALVDNTSGVANASTGLDLIVKPSGVKVSLDGRPIGKAPLQIRSLRPGEHFIEIEAPPGFFSKSETVTIEQDKADRVEIKLEAMKIVGTFESSPPGAEVLLIADGVSQSLGLSPATHPIDPSKRYEVVFKKNGYATVTKPIEITGSTSLSVVGTLAKARAAKVPSVALAPKPKGPPKAFVTPKPDLPAVTPRPPSPKPPIVASDAAGTLLLSAKPPCKIFIDGRDTGKMTPQRGIKLSVGKHRVTLLNNQLGIKESFNVRISAGKATKALKDYTDQID